ncbi:hypothetical protein HYU15_02190 [Candidatus Woesearchaeota archaeon]|nr:hypothetical protein [Candidatus Woesearchaeota archaeon]
MNKGQISGQVFVFIFALIVASATLLMGYNYLQKLRSAGIQADMTIFQKDLTADIKSAKTYGTELKNKKYNKATIRDSITSKARKNVFLWPQGKESFFYADGIAVYGKYACFKALKGVVRVNMTGCGDRTVIASIPSDTATVCT